MSYESFESFEPFKSFCPLISQKPQTKKTIRRTGLASMCSSTCQILLLGMLYPPRKTTQWQPLEELSNHKVRRAV